MMYCVIICSELRVENKAAMATARKPSDHFWECKPPPPCLVRSRGFYGYAHDDISAWLEAGFFCPQGFVAPFRAWA